MYSPPFPLMLTYGPKHENFKVDAADLDIDRFRKKMVPIGIKWTK